MLENVDLETKVGRKEAKAQINALKNDIMVLQQKMRDLKIPMIILFEGWDAAGKGTQITNLVEQLDTRAFRVYSTDWPTEDEKKYPFLWRYWQRIPEYGKISIFDESWYQEVAWGAYLGHFSDAEISKRYNEIVEFERQLLWDGYIVIKIFLHLSKKEQHKRQKKQLSDPYTYRYVTDNNLLQNENYEEFETIYNDMIQRTNRIYAPWHLVAAEDNEVCQITYLTKIRDTMKDVIETRSAGVYMFDKTEAAIDDTFKHVKMPLLKDVDLSVSYTDEEYKKTKKKLAKRLDILQNELYYRKIPLVVLYEGWDAGGKGGNIRRLTQCLDPRSYVINTTASPTPLEKSYHYLWRFWRNLPEEGKIAIFDRTWYGRVMVERLEGFAREAEWKRAYREINEFEKMLTDWGAIVIKFWIQIDQEEQLRRFTERQNNPDKQWKITDEDWRNREKWPQYEEAINEMLQKTSTETAPWTIVEGNDKKYARIKAMQTIIDAAEARLKK